MKIFKTFIAVLATLSIISCGGEASWNKTEEDAYNGFKETKAKTQTILGGISRENAPKYDESKEMSKPVWDWKGFEGSAISQLYKEWRRSSAVAIETKARHVRSNLGDPQIGFLKAQLDFELDNAKQKAEEIEKEVARLKKGQ